MATPAYPVVPWIGFGKEMKTVSGKKKLNLKDDSENRCIECDRPLKWVRIENGRKYSEECCDGAQNIEGTCSEEIQQLITRFKGE